MSFYFNGAQANVTLSGGASLPIPSSTQTPIHVWGDAKNGNQDFYTVPAGKTFYLYGATLATANVNFTVYENDGTTKVLICWCGATAITNSVVSGAVPLAVYTTGQIVKTNTGAGASYGIWGLLQG